MSLYFCNEPSVEMYRSIWMFRQFVVVRRSSRLNKCQVAVHSAGASDVDLNLKPYAVHLCYVMSASNHFSFPSDVRKLETASKRNAILKTQTTGLRTYNGENPADELNDPMDLL